MPAWLRWSLVGTTEIEEALEGEHGHHGAPKLVELVENALVELVEEALEGEHGHHEAPRLERVEDALVERVLFLH